jgi:hypothetical protein
LFFCADAFGTTPDSTESHVKGKLYHVNRPIVGAIIAAGLGSDALAISRIKDKPDISAAELSTLNTGVINSFDRWALNQNPANHLMYANISDLAQIPIILLPGLLAFDKDISKDWWDILLMYAEGHTITFTFYNYSPLGPTFENKYRPITYYTQLPLSEREDGNNRNSFYSGHTASCAYSTFFMAKVWCDYHPDMGAGEKYLLYVAAALPPIAMGYLRVRALDHFPSDDAVGLFLGSAIGIIIPELHKFHNNNLSLGMFSSPDGTGLNIKWTLPCQHPSASSSFKGALAPGTM